MSTTSDAEMVNAASTDSSPEMPSPLDTTVKLLRGIREENEDGVVWHDHAEVRELTGDDEEALDALASKKGVSYTEYMNAILERAVVRIGSLSISEHPKALGKLILADRNYLFLSIVRATYGNTRTIRARCPECGISNDVDIVLDEDFKFEEPEVSLREPIEVETHKGVYKVRFPNGEDLVDAQENGKTDAASNSIILARTLVFDGEEPEDIPAFVKGLNAGVRSKLVTTLVELKAGPSLEEVDTQCAECGADMPILLDWVSLLLG